MVAHVVSQTNDDYTLITSFFSTQAISNDPFDATLIIIIIAIVIGLLLLLIIGGLIGFSIYSYATKGKRKTFPLREVSDISSSSLAIITNFKSYRK